jgi:hypothetical protein
LTTSRKAISPECEIEPTRKLCARCNSILKVCHDQSGGFRVLRNHFRFCPDARGIRLTPRRYSRWRSQGWQLPRSLSRRFTRRRLSWLPGGGVGRPALLERRQTLVWICGKAVLGVRCGGAGWRLLQLPGVLILIYEPKRLCRHRNGARRRASRACSWHLRHLLLLERRQLRRCSREVVAACRCCEELRASSVVNAPKPVQFCVPTPPRHVTTAGVLSG